VAPALQGGVSASPAAALVPAKADDVVWPTPP
jgi:hypothetical protein